LFRAIPPRSPPVGGRLRCGRRLRVSNAFSFSEHIIGKNVITAEICTKKSDGTEVCASGDQLAAILAGKSAGAPEGSEGEAPASMSAQTERSNANTTTTTTSSTEEPLTSAEDARHQDEDAQVQEGRTGSQPSEDNEPIVHGTAPASSLPTASPGQRAASSRGSSRSERQRACRATPNRHGIERSTARSAHLSSAKIREPLPVQNA
jgi:hypothetical protein